MNDYLYHMQKSQRQRDDLREFVRNVKGLVLPLVALGIAIVYYCGGI